MWQAKYDRGEEVPQAFFDRPEIEDDLRPYWAAFNDLGTERQIGMSLGPIPWSKVAEYADRYGMDETLLQTVIRKVDSDYLKMLSPDSEDKKMRSQASMSDGAGVARLFAGIESRQKASRKKQ